MKPTDPLLLRCLALTGSFETGKLPPGCFSSLAGDFDHMGISFSALQWNFGQKTLQALLNKMLARYEAVMAAVFGANLDILRHALSQDLVVQMAWVRGIQAGGRFLSDWSLAFSKLGETAEWQAVAQESAALYMDQAKFQASQLGLKSDRAIALTFDCAIQNGGVSALARHHVSDIMLPGWEEPEIMRAVANAVADGAIPKYRPDVLERKLCIANGSGVVHGIHYDLEKDFGL